MPFKGKNVLITGGASGIGQGDCRTTSTTLSEKNNSH